MQNNKGTSGAEAVKKPKAKAAAKKKATSFDEAKFQPGQSGNPAGRPKGTKNGLRARLVQMLDQQTEADILQVFEAKGVQLEDKDKAAVIAMVLGREAMKGNMQAVKIIAEQTEQPHPKDLKLTGDFNVNMPKEDADTL